MIGRLSRFAIQPRTNARDNLSRASRIFEIPRAFKFYKFRQICISTNTSWCRAENRWFTRNKSLEIYWSSVIVVALCAQREWTVHKTVRPIHVAQDHHHRHPSSRVTLQQKRDWLSRILCVNERMYVPIVQSRAVRGSVICRAKSTDNCHRSRFFARFSIDLERDKSRTETFNPRRYLTPYAVRVH